jgi:hypothetical protein
MSDQKERRGLSVVPRRSVGGFGRRCGRPVASMARQLLRKLKGSRLMSAERVFASAAPHACGLTAALLGGTGICNPVGKSSSVSSPITVD